MEKDKDFWELQRDLTFEWSRYVINNPQILDKIPDGAQIVFLLDNNKAFTNWSLEMNKAKREIGQPLLFIHVKALLPSRLVEPQLEPAL